MKTIKAMIWLMVIALGLGITVLSLPHAANAQTDRTKNEKEKEEDDKDDDDDEELTADDKKQVKINLAEARAIALKQVSGTVIEEELEKENGRLQYALDIRTDDGKIFDVEIDAMTGEVLQAIEDDEDDDIDDDDDERLSPEETKRAKISLDEARAIALKRIGGKVIEEELEKENGRLQYAFDIRTADGRIFDVEVDAMTGEVLQAIEDDEDDDNNRSSFSKAKNSVYRAANTVKNVTVRMVGKLF